MEDTVGSNAGLLWNLKDQNWVWAGDPTCFEKPVVLSGMLMQTPQRTFDVAIYQYRSGFFPVGLVGLDGHAEALVQEIEEQAKDHGYTQVGLAGHSMGGLIVSLAANILMKRALTDSSNEGVTPVLSGLLCVGTPWDGVVMAWPASLINRQLRDVSGGGAEVRMRAREKGFIQSLANGIWARNDVAIGDGLVAPQPVKSALPRYWIWTTHTGAVAATSAEDSKFHPFSEWALQASQASLLVYLRELRRRVENLGIRSVTENKTEDFYQNRSATEWGAREEDDANRPEWRLTPDSQGTFTEGARLSN
ncbi:MAG: alpha/beta fold hydrolase, partial [Candidatus Hydrogenedentes bacterium]|nr:alpha/beta fold hydrolase [Candidatus Hydrogenedentota bacterium]